MAKPKIDFQKIAIKTAGLGAGGIGAGILEKNLPEAIPMQLRPVAIVAAGAFLPILLGGKQELFTHIGDGMIASGARGLAAQFFPDMVSGLDEREYLAGPSTISDIDIADQYIFEDRGPGVNSLPGGQRIEQTERQKQYTI